MASYVRYMGASLTSGYGMSFRENFVHHSLEVTFTPCVRAKGTLRSLAVCTTRSSYALPCVWTEGPLCSLALCTTRSRQSKAKGLCAH